MRGYGRTYPAAKLEEDTKRRQDDGQQDVYASSCSLVCHLLNSSERSIYTALEKLFFFFAVLIYSAIYRELKIEVGYI
jgi:hypothetical protein